MPQAAAHQDDTAGKQAKCPVCGTLVPIPDPASPPPLPVDIARPPLSPAAASAIDRSDVRRRRHWIGHCADGRWQQTLTAPPLEIGELMSLAWRILRRRFRLCIGATLVATIVYYAVAIGLAMPIFLAFFQTGDRQEPPSPLLVLIGVGWWLAENFLYSLLLAGQAVFFLKIARGEPAALADFFSGWRWALTAFFVYLVSYLAVTLGFLLLIVPGIIVLLMLSQVMFLVVDRHATLSDALQMSRKLTDGHKVESVRLVAARLGIVVGREPSLLSRANRFSTLGGHSRRGGLSQAVGPVDRRRHRRISRPAIGRSKESAAAARASYRGSGAIRSVSGLLAVAYSRLGIRPAR